MKRVLVIGGTYFVGKSFLSNIIDNYIREEKDELELTVLNRGSRSIKEVLGGQYGSAIASERIGFKELSCDRTDENALRGVLSGKERFDAVVDFCAYNPGDIEKVFNTLDTAPGQYIFLSTCDVYERGTGRVSDEDAPFERRSFPGEAGAYISGKVALEEELEKLCDSTKTVKTVFRPSVIFGEGNYAPREGMYFKWISGAGQIIHPEDASGTFQLTYVGDVAEALTRCLFTEAAYGKTYNLIGTKPLSYDDFADILEKATGRAIERVKMPASEIAARGIPLPFPLYAEESETYTGERIKELGLTYSDVTEAMRKTWEAWLPK